MQLLLRIALVIGGVLALLVTLAWVGLLIRPKSLPAFAGPAPALERIPIPDGLPAPVARFYRTIAGESVPVITSAVLSGRGDLRFGGVRLPARWRFTHQAGEAYRHYIETTLFGLPIMRVNEHFLEGKARLELPVGIVEHEPKVDMAANLSLWGEAVLFPSLFLTDPRVRWEPIDAQQARLVVPDGDGEDSFTVTFDPETGLIQTMAAMRWKEATSPAKTLWLCSPTAWERFDGVLLPSGFAVQWGDEELPWLVAVTEEILYNVDVDTYIRAFGP